MSSTASDPESMVFLSLGSGLGAEPFRDCVGATDQGFAGTWVSQMHLAAFYLPCGELAGVLLQARVKIPCAH